MSWLCMGQYLVWRQESQSIHSLSLPKVTHCLLFTTEQFPTHFFAHSADGIKVSCLYFSYIFTLWLLGVIRSYGSPAGDLWDTGLSLTQQLAVRSLCLAGGPSAWSLLVPCELRQLLTLSNSLVWSQHLLTDSYPGLMSCSSTRHILTFTFSLLTFPLSFSSPLKMRWVDSL